MVGTVEQAVEMKREKQRLEEMSDWEMKYLPKGIRIDIPLKSATHLLPVARILHEFASVMERIAPYCPTAFSITFLMGGCLQPVFRL